MPNKKKIYLAGGMEKRKDNGMTWRRIITPLLEALGYSIYNPCLEETDIFEKFGVKPSDIETLKKYDFPTCKELFFDICEKDIQAIKSSDIMIVYYDDSVNLSSGTVSEMTLARHIFKMPIYIIKKVSRSSIPGWTSGCLYPNVPEFKSIEECIEYIKKLGN